MGDLINSTEWGSRDELDAIAQLALLWEQSSLTLESVWSPSGCSCADRN
jgi:hypothetical protein